MRECGPDIASPLFLSTCALKLKEVPTLAERKSSDMKIAQVMWSGASKEPLQRASLSFDDHQFHSQVISLVASTMLWDA